MSDDRTAEDSQTRQAHGAETAPERRERADARENRKQLLLVAKQLFATQGVAATNMKQIAAAAGLGKGTLYRHFAHKGELCRALLNDDLIAFQERLGRLIGNAEVVASPLARLDLLNTERILLMESHLPLFAAIKVAAAGSRPDRPFRGPFSEWMHMRMVELLREAVEQGELAALDLDFTADAILETLSPALYSYHRHMCGYSIERIVAGVRRIFVDGLRQAPSL